MAAGGEIVGRRLSVYWDEDRKWFEGQIDDYEGELCQHHITYDDGDEEWVDLGGGGTRWRLLADENGLPEPSSASGRAQRLTAPCRWLSAEYGEELQEERLTGKKRLATTGKAYDQAAVKKFKEAKHTLMLADKAVRDAEASHDVLQELQALRALREEIKKALK